MNKNQYKQATKHFNIPVPGWDDGIWPELELLKWQMIENMLLAAMRGNVNAIFREGDLRVIQEKDGTFTAMLSATGNEPSVQGSVGGAFFEAASTVLWKGLEVGQSYYLYVQGTTKTFYEASNISLVSSVIRLVNKYVTLVAKIDLTGEKIEIDRNPPGKINARDLAQHVLDYDNPHGSQLSQDELLIRKHLAIGVGNDADIEFDVNGNVIHLPLSKIVSVLNETKTFVDFLSGGIKGITLCAERKIVFATVVKIGEITTKVGEINIGFFGVNPNVQNQNQIIVYNSGEEGIPMRAMILCE